MEDAPTAEKREIDHFGEPEKKKKNRRQAASESSANWQQATTTPDAPRYNKGRKTRQLLRARYAEQLIAREKKTTSQVEVGRDTTAEVEAYLMSVFTLFGFLAFFMSQANGPVAPPKLMFVYILVLCL